VASSNQIGPDDRGQLGYVAAHYGQIPCMIEALAILCRLRHPRPIQPMARRLSEVRRERAQGS
jgi:hypothetical protein